mgnify:CR=1 FL=1
MDNLAEALEHQARVMLLQQSLYRLIEQHGGSVELPFAEVMDGSGMGGVAIEVNGETGMIKLTAMDEATCDAFQESLKRDTDPN